MKTDLTCQKGGRLSLCIDNLCLFVFFQASDQSAKIQLEATHFIIRFDSPCKDWLEIGIGKRSRRLCGAYRSTLESSGYNLTFHSDEEGGHQGVWLHFARKNFVELLTPRIGNLNPEPLQVFPQERQRDRKRWREKESENFSLKRVCPDECQNLRRN